MRATDIMRSSFATVKPGTSVLDAARLLLETNQRGLPVVDEEGGLVGIVSEGDFLHRDELGVMPPAGNWLEQLLGIEEVTPALERMRALLVGEIMTENPVYIEKDASVDDVIEAMDLRNIAQLPVVGSGKVVGMISRFELIAALERCLCQSERAAEATA